MSPSALDRPRWGRRLKPPQTPGAPMTAASIPSTAFRPPRPVPHDGADRHAADDPDVAAQPARNLVAGALRKADPDGAQHRRHASVVSEPAAVRQVFLDNAANYRKDALQLRVLEPGLGKGLLTIDGEDWRAQRPRVGACFPHARRLPSRPPCTAWRPLPSSALRQSGKGASSTPRRKWRGSRCRCWSRLSFRKGSVATPASFKSPSRVISIRSAASIRSISSRARRSSCPTRLGPCATRSAMEFFACAAVGDIIEARKGLLASRSRRPPTTF